MGDDRTPRQTDPGGQVPPGALSALLDRARALSAHGRAADRPRRSPSPPGTTLGRFETCCERLGRGGFGVVYEAAGSGPRPPRRFQGGADRIRDRLRSAQERLQREAEAAARLSHPNLVTLARRGPDPKRDRSWSSSSSMGSTLADRLDQGPIPVHRGPRHRRPGGARPRLRARPRGRPPRSEARQRVPLRRRPGEDPATSAWPTRSGSRESTAGRPRTWPPSSGCRRRRTSAPTSTRWASCCTGCWPGEVPFRRSAGRQGAALRPRHPALDVPAFRGSGSWPRGCSRAARCERPRDGSGGAASAGGLPGGAPDLLHRPAFRPRRRRKWLDLRRSRPLAMGGLGCACGGRRSAGAAAVVLEGRSPASPARPVVAVADAQNATGDPDLDGVSGLLVTSLEQSRRLGVLTRGSMIDLARQAGHDKVERIDEVVGRDVVRKAGAAALLVPNVHRLGSTYAVELRAIDPRRDSYIFTLRDQSPSKEGHPAPHRPDERSGPQGAERARRRGGRADGRGSSSR